MHFLFLAVLLASTIKRVSAACSSALLIDDFSKYSPTGNTNSLGSWTDDDGTLSFASASAGTLSFTPKSGSIFYETFPCQTASTDGYNALRFTIKGPAGGSFSLELQTKTSCSASSYTSKYHTETGLTGSIQTITIPWTSWSGANTNAIVAVVWYGFSSNTAGWQISNIQFTCSTAGSSVLLPSSSPKYSVISSTATSFVRIASSSTTTLSTSAASSLISSISSSRRSSSTVVPKSSIASNLRPSSSVLKVVSSSSASSSSNAASSRVASSRMSLVSSTLVSSASPISSACSDLLIEDFSSQSRLTFLYYNSMLQPTSDDGTMKSVIVDSLTNRATFTPSGASSYWFSQLGCTNAQNMYGGISLRIKAPAGTTLGIQLGYLKNCGDTMQNMVDASSQSLGWTFDGSEKLYSFKFSQFPGLDSSKISTLLLEGFSKAITLGPISMYCGDTPSEYIVPSHSTVVAPTGTVPAPSGTASAFILDKFDNADTNAQGHWHGGDEEITLTWTSGHLKILSNDPDYAFYTQFTDTCKDMTSYEDSYLHIKYSGSTSFSIALQQHNAACNNDAAPYPETWDEVEAGRYASNGDIYVPMSHFNVEKTRTIGVALKSWYSTATTTLSLIEIVPAVPAGFKIESKLPTGNLVFACKRPNSFAFCIDDGDPALAQQVLKIVKDANIKVTFFTVGAPLLDPSTNLSNVYKEMIGEGHQVALHSYTHPKMEGLPDYNAMDWEYNTDIAVVAQTFNGLHSPYFRPPFGTEGARMRYRWTQAAGRDDAYIVNWSVDVQDWLWATTTTPEKQIDAFKSDVDKGGNLVVMHYLYQSTVNYLPQFIEYAKASGKELMRLDQCMNDPSAPPL